MSIAIKPKEYTYEHLKEQPDDMLYELLDGVIYAMASPTSAHQRIVGYLFNKLYNYLDGKKCEAFISPFTVFLMDDPEDSIKKCKNAVIPDISVICDPGKIIKEGCAGAPDFIIEVVSPSTKRTDFIKKLYLYSEYGVKEYWIVNPSDSSVLVYLLEQNAVDRENIPNPLMFSFDDMIKVNLFEDFAIDFSKLGLRGGVI